MEQVLEASRRLLQLIPAGREPVAESLLSLPALSHSGAIYLWNTLKRYEFSLSMIGLQIPAKPELPAPPPVVLPDGPFCDFIGGKFVMRLSFAQEEKVYMVPRIKHDKKTQLYTVPYRLYPVLKLREFIKHVDLFITPGARQAILDMLYEIRDRYKWSSAHDAEIDMQGFGLALDPFQRAGVKGALSFKRGFIADAMGLGKTRQALGVLHLSRAFPALLVCPASVTINWEREARGEVGGGTTGICVPLPNGEIPRIWRARSRSLPQHTCDGSTAQLSLFTEARFDEHCQRCQFENAHLYIVNYHKLSDGWSVQYDQNHVKIKNRKRQKGERAEVHLSEVGRALKQRGLRFIGIDESQKVKNEETQQHKAVKTLAEGTTYRYCLSGTPIKSRISEIIGQLKILDRLDDLGGEDVFYRRFIDTPDQGAQLNKELRGIGFIQRRKRDVRKELPPVRYATLWFEIDNRAEYERVEEDVITWCGEQAVLKAEFQKMLAELPPGEHAAAVERKKIETQLRVMKAAAMIRIGALKKVAARGMVSAVIEWIEDFIEAGEDKLVTFAHFVDIQKRIANHFNCLHIRGEDAIHLRQLHKEIFQGETGNLIGLNAQQIVVSFGAGAEGLNLDAADNILLTDRCWTPADEAQAIARVDRHRVHNITAYRAMAVDTIFTTIAKRLTEREKIVEAVTTGLVDEATAQRASTTSVLDEVFDELATLSAHKGSGDDVRRKAENLLLGDTDKILQETEAAVTEFSEAVI